MKLIPLGAKVFALGFLPIFGMVVLLSEPKVVSQPKAGQRVLQSDGTARKLPVVAVVTKVKDSLKNDNARKLQLHKQEDELIRSENGSLKRQITELRQRFDDSTAAYAKRDKQAKANAKIVRDRVKKIELRPAQNSMEQGVDGMLASADPTLIITGRDTVPMPVYVPVYLRERTEKVGRWPFRKTVKYTDTVTANIGKP